MFFFWNTSRDNENQCKWTRWIEETIQSKQMGCRNNFGVFFSFASPFILLDFSCLIDTWNLKIFFWNYNQGTFWFIFYFPLVKSTRWMKADWFWSNNPWMMCIWHMQKIPMTTAIDIFASVTILLLKWAVKYFHFFLDILPLKSV